MDTASAYLPWDRRLALAHRLELPTAAHGAALFVDISGFTPLTNLLVHRYGPRRGVDELTRRLNAVYTALIAEVERYGGSVIGFSGDGITCWYAAESPLLALNTQDASTVGATGRACASAFAIHAAMISFQTQEVGGGHAIALAVKTAIAAGLTHRFCVGDPAIQLIDVLAGATVDRMAAAEKMAQKGELLLDAATAQQLADTITIADWRTDDNGARFAVVAELRQPVAPVEPGVSPESLSASEVRRWVLPSIYRRLQDEQSRFLAELRPATALFLRFTGIDYDQDLEAGARLNAYIAWVQQVVNRYEGALIQLTTGDKGSYLYAAFGAPIAHDDDNERALAAALELRTPPANLSFITTTQIGISQGTMRTGAYGSPTRRTYGVLSEETILAARLMSQAQPGQILVSVAVAAAVNERFDMLDAGLLKLKGWEEPQAAYAVWGPRQPSADPLYSRFSAPLVGRTTELAALTPALEQTLQGQGSLVRMEGPAGVGKSHLAAAFAQEAIGRGLRIVRAVCQSTSQDVAYSATGQMLRALLRLPLDLTQAEQLALIEAALQELNSAWLVRMPLLGDLLNLAIPDNPTTAAFDPRLRQEALVTLAVEIVLALARREPLLLLFEDIHWMDEASQGLLLALARMVADIPVLLLLVQRPSLRDEDRFLADVAALPGQFHLALGELPAQGLSELVRYRLQGGVDPLALALIQAQTQGNPFFAEELVDALRDSGQLLLGAAGWHLSDALIEALRNADCLEERAGAWHLAADAPLSAVEMGLPSTVQGIVLARLDRLPEQAKLTLKVASVIGGVFEYDVLTQAHPLQMAETELSEQLTLLLARDFARLETPAPRLSYTFKHNITQEVAYQTLLEDQRQELHLSVAHVLEQLHADRIDDLAFHYVRGDLDCRPVRNKALYYLDAAGRRAQREYANETALSYFNRALALEARWPWLKAKIEVLHILGRRAEQIKTLALLQAAPNAPAFEAALLWGEYYEAISEYERAQQALQQALDLARSHRDAEGEARCLARLGLIAWSQGNYETAEQVYTEALASIGEEERYRDEEAEIRRGLGLVYRQQGKYEEAEAQFQRNLALNRLLNNRPGEARSLNMLGILEFYRRNMDAALTYYRQAQQIYEAVGDLAGVASCLFSIGQGASTSGDYAEAEILLQQALQIYERINDGWWQLFTWNELGVLYLVVGEYTKAQQCLVQGLELSRARGVDSGEAYLLCNLGQVQRELGNLSQAEASLQAALQLAQAQSDVQLEAICYSDLALVSLSTANYSDTLERALASLAKFRICDLELSTTAVLATLAVAYLALGDERKALSYAHQAVALLDACSGDGPDYPQRDYWVCHQVFQALGEPALAQHALQAARRLLMTNADKITDPHMRESFLRNISHNRTILIAFGETIGMPQG
jgi:adenylate cyclase